MRSNAAQALFPKVRRNVLGAMLLHPQKRWYLSQLARFIQAAPSHVHRELALLADAGILIREEEGRQTYYHVNRRCPFVPELTGLLKKLLGAPSVLAAMLRAFGSKVRCAFIYGSVARGSEVAESDVDLLIVGDVSLEDLLPGLKQAERALGRPVNPTVYPSGELARKYKAGHHFIRSVLKDPAKTFVVGTARDLEAIASGKANQAASDEPSGGRRPARGRRSQT